MAESIMKIRDISVRFVVAECLNHLLFLEFINAIPVVNSERLSLLDQLINRAEAAAMNSADVAGDSAEASVSDSISIRGSHAIVLLVFLKQYSEGRSRNVLNWVMPFSVLQRIATLFLKLLGFLERLPSDKNPFIQVQCNNFNKSREILVTFV
jgi:hypothetical protein